VAWEPGFADRLPAGMRLPRLYRLAELGDDRAQSRVGLASMPLLERDEVWAHPLLAGAVDDRLRGDLRARVGELPAAALPGIHPALAPAYTDALRAAGGRASLDEVTFGYVASLAIRAGFTSLPSERLGAPPTPELAATFRERAAPTRFVVDLGLSLP
jgi:hypothetical protein